MDPSIYLNEMVQKTQLYNGGAVWTYSQGLVRGQHSYPNHDPLPQSIQLTSTIIETCNLHWFPTNMIDFTSVGSHCVEFRSLRH